MKQSNFGVIGLGVMGSNLSLNIAEKGHQLSVYNRSEGNEINIIRDFLNDHSDFRNIAGFTDLSTFVNSLKTPRKILLMIKAGSVIDSVLEQLTPLLSENDVVIDGGNSHYLDSKRRFETLQKSKIHFVGTGISGGESGARKGPSIMPGGNLESYQLIAPILESIAAKDKNGNPCCTFIGKDGAGHFIKMVHNGIEYAEMQLLAECYALLKS
ncbi:MAG: 6-phosphogluconate dehydrogenase, partial [Saprospiraceae bacterium]